MTSRGKKFPKSPDLAAITSLKTFFAISAYRLARCSTDLNSRAYVPAMGGMRA